MLRGQAARRSARAAPGKAAIFIPWRPGQLSRPPWAPERRNAPPRQPLSRVLECAAAPPNSGSPVPNLRRRPHPLARRCPKMATRSGDILAVCDGWGGALFCRGGPSTFRGAVPGPSERGGSYPVACPSGPSWSRQEPAAPTLLLEATRTRPPLPCSALSMVLKFPGGHAGRLASRGRSGGSRVCGTPGPRVRRVGADSVVVVVPPVAPENAGSKGGMFIPCLLPPACAADPVLQTGWCASQPAPLQREALGPSPLCCSPPACCLPLSQGATHKSTETLWSSGGCLIGILAGNARSW